MDSWDLLASQSLGLFGELQANGKAANTTQRETGAIEMVLWVKALAVEAELDPQIHKVEGENRIPQVVP